MAPLMMRFLKVNGFGQITVPVTESEELMFEVDATFMVDATLIVVHEINGIVRVSKLKFVFVEFDVNPAAIIFVVVRVFDTTKFANG
jgi:hypothetical protein